MYAVVDLGSFTAKLTIANIDTQIKVVEKDELSIGLGQDFSRERVLKCEAINKAVEVVRRWQKRIKQCQVVRTGIFATGVSQIARNRDQFADIMFRETGLALKILSESDEARILSEGVVDDFPEGFTYFILNVGGGTTRLVVRKRREVMKLFCVAVGTIELSRMLKSDPPHAEEVYSLNKKIEDSFEKVRLKSLPKERVLLHTGGELDYVLATGCKVNRSALSPTHPYRVRLVDFKELDQKIRYMSREQRRLFRPDNPKWMDGAVASNSLAIHVAEKFAFDELIPSNKNVIDGFLLEVARQTQGESVK